MVKPLNFLMVRVVMLVVSERMRITQHGRVGIGTTNPGSSYKLDVNGNGNFGGDLTFSGQIYGDGSQLTGVSSFWTGTSGSDICYNGNVGIGTNIPSNYSKLHVHPGDKDLELRIDEDENNDDDDTNSIVFKNTGGSYTWRIGRRYLLGEIPPVIVH